MSHLLLASTPLYGHVAPLVTVGQGLRAAGHQVSLLTGRKYAELVTGAGLRFLPLPSEVDYDDADLTSFLPGHGTLTGLAAGRHDVIGLFVDPLVAQHRAVAAALAAEAYDAVVADAAFLGVLPTALRPRSDRLPVFAVSATPLSLTSVDCAPFGSGLPPGRSRHSRFRNRVLNAVLPRGFLRPVQEALDAALATCGGPPAPVGYLDLAAIFETTFQLSVAALEYPRRELPSGVRFVGPLTLPVSAQALPAWWSDLDGSRPVVHVTQGTMDNIDLGRVLGPAARGLAKDDVLVVATTGGRPVTDLLDRLPAVPANLRVAEFLPYDQLLPHVDVVVTNGGFGGVQRALAAGVPLVVAGATEDKPEVAARVAWVGAGVDLRTGVPSPRRVRRAVRAVLTDPTYAAAAARLQTQIREQGDPVAAIVAEVAAELARREVPGRPAPARAG
ncbi:MAG: glycosyl transferase [Friedmanniella sp.]|nr:glycosyl transferase [Friedmanniella sp.]